MYSTLKLERVASLCGGTLSAISLGLLLEDRRYSMEQIAAAASTTPIMLARALAEPEPTVYAPLISQDEGDSVYE
jgi:hypothetical protein